MCSDENDFIMKSKLMIPGLMIVLGLLITGCMKNTPDQTYMNEQEIVLLQGMKNSFEYAKLYNDTLHAIDKSTSKVKFAHYDSAYHYYVNCYDSLHYLYPHNNEDADHNHDSHGMYQMMVIMKNRLCGVPWKNGHHAIEHDRMDQLESEHVSIFHNRQAL